MDPVVVHEWSAAAAPPELPRKLPNGAVWVGQQHVGRVSYIHSERGFRLFAYCRMHGCYKGITSNKNPFESGALKWLGAALRPDVKTRAAHEALFQEYILNP